MSHSSQPVQFMSYTGVIIKKFTLVQRNALGMSPHLTDFYGLYYK